MLHQNIVHAETLAITGWQICEILSFSRARQIESDRKTEKDNRDKKADAIVSKREVYPHPLSDTSLSGPCDLSSDIKE